MTDAAPPIERSSAEPITAVVADRVRTAREAIGLSQGELAERLQQRCGLTWTRTTVINLERRSPRSRTKRTNATPGRDALTLREWLSLAAVLGVPPVWLLADPTSADMPMNVAGDDYLDAWTAMLWVSGREFPRIGRPWLEPEPWSIPAEAIQKVTEIRALIREMEQLAGMRDVLSIITPPRGDGEADRATEQRVLSGIRKREDWLLERGYQVPPIPDEVRRRAVELAVELHAAVGEDEP